MTSEPAYYKSSETKTEEQAKSYLQTHDDPFRYLAYKDLPKLIRELVQGLRVLDFGAGTGASSEFLHNLGLDVLGLDVCFNMLEKARSNFPHLKFCHATDPVTQGSFDLVFSSFVLLELPCKKEIANYLNKASSFLKDNGIFIGITASERLYSLSRDWSTFNVTFKENQNLQSGNIAKTSLKHSTIEFHDYYWREPDYLDCFKKAGLKVLQIHSPLGSPNDPYSWKDELHHSPFIIFVAGKA